MTHEMLLADDLRNKLAAGGGAAIPLGLSIAIRATEHGEALPVDESFVAVMLHGVVLGETTLPPLSALFRGTAKCAEIASDPPRALEPIFMCVELTALDWCGVSGRRVRDEEFEKLYSDLRRRPDGRSKDPLFGYLRAAMRLTLAIRPTSADEFEAITRRLARSARTFRTSVTSTNYLDLALRPLVRS